MVRMNPQAKGFCLLLTKLGLGSTGRAWYDGCMERANMLTTKIRTDTSEVAVFSRLLTNNQRKMGTDLARYLLGIGFSEADQARMQELAEKNQAGRISPEERDELFSYVKAGHLLAILQSRARKALKKKR